MSIYATVVGNIFSRGWHLDFCLIYATVVGNIFSRGGVYSVNVVFMHLVSKEDINCSLSGFKHFIGYWLDMHWPDLDNCVVYNISVVCTHPALEGGAMRKYLCLEALSRLIIGH